MAIKKEIFDEFLKELEKINIPSGIIQKFKEIFENEEKISKKILYEILEKESEIDRCKDK